MRYLQIWLFKLIFWESNQIKFPAPNLNSNNFKYHILSGFLQIEVFFAKTHGPHTVDQGKGVNKQNGTEQKPVTVSGRWL